MANLKFVEEHDLPLWADLGLESTSGTYTYRVTVAFTGKENGKSVKPTYVGMNPFDETFAFSVGGFMLQGNILDTSIKYGSDHGVREYDVTKVYPEGDTIVFDVVKQSGDMGKSANPDKIIIRELTEQEKEYVDKVEEQNLSFMVDRRNELS
jgi:hypothetical protein